MTIRRRCYMCEAEGSTSEHVPPRALFPQAKDAAGQDHRADLITVPSCELHNMGKSRDDEFLMVSLAGIIGNNSIGYRHKFTKVNRAIRRTSYKLLMGAFASKPKLHVVDLGNNRFIDVLWGTPDQARLAFCFERIVRGLHYHHFGIPYAGQVKVLIGYLSYETGSTRNLQRFMLDKAEMELECRPKFGRNQDVFYYQVTDPDEFGLSLFRLCFYGGVNVYVSLIPDSAEAPKHLGFELMKRGIKTMFTLGDRTYEADFGREDSRTPSAAADAGKTMQPDQYRDWPSHVSTPHHLAI